MSALAVAWDIDGTLIDSEPLHHRGLVEVCRNWGVDLSRLPEHAFRGVHMEDVWRALRGRMPPGAEREAWLDAISAYYLDNCIQLRPMPNAVETIATLAARGIRQGCVSNSCRSIVDANLAAMGVGDLIDFSVSLDDVERGKPDPYPYAFACRKLGLQPSAVVAVEDTVAGMTSARSAGLVVLEYGPPGKGSDLATARISDLAQVLDYCS